MSASTQESMDSMQTAPAYTVTARKYRPQLFGDVVGQEHISTTLTNAITQHRVHHAYLFCGPRGVGKTTTARIFARALNCSNPISGVEPCNECSSCLDILNGRSLDVIEIDGASNNSVDDIRKLRENAKYPPVHGKYKMYIIDEVHMLSTSAFNALLKTLEEPPPHLLFMFATTESHKVPATIVSRCQRFDFRRMQIESIVHHLASIAAKEHVVIDEESLIAIAKKGDGSMRDSQSIFDQVRAFCGDTIAFSEVANALHLLDEEFFFAISDAMLEKNTAIMFGLVDQVVSKGYDIHECLSGMQMHFRNILSVVSTGSTHLIESSSAILERYTASAARFRQAEVLRIMSMISRTEQQLKLSAQPRALFEVLLVSLASLDDIVEISELVREIREAKKGGTKVNMLSSAVHATTPVPPPEVIAKRAAAAEARTMLATAAASSAAATSASASMQTQPIAATRVATRPAATATTSVRNTAPATDSATGSTTDSATGTVSASVLENRWDEFVSSLPPSLAGVKMALKTGQYSMVEFSDADIHVVVRSEEFMYKDISASKAALGTRLEKFYGSHVRVRVSYAGAENIDTAASAGDATVSADTTAAVGTMQGNSAHGAAQSTAKGTAQGTPSEKSTVERILVEAFGAKKIPLPGT
ncbi:MAG: DNA polymerase III subunit gamma/tau [Candidatus Kapaibacterium sp.]